MTTHKTHCPHISQNALAAGTVIPLLNHCKMIFINCDTSDYTPVKVIVTLSHVQLPLCSYSGVQNTVTGHECELFRLWLDPIPIPLHYHGAQCDLGISSIWWWRLPRVLSAQVVTWRYTFVWVHNNKSHIIIRGSASQRITEPRLASTLSWYHLWSALIFPVA
jgi:hypothetical protein